MTEITTNEVAGATGLEPAASGVTGRGFSSKNNATRLCGPGKSGSKTQRVVTPAQAAGAFVYVLVRPGRCKIGSSIAAVKRGRAIAAQGGFTDIGLHIALPVIAGLAVEIEHAAHHELRAHRIRGEWFEVEPKLAVEAIERALLAVTRRHALASESLSPKPGRDRNGCLSLSIPDGQAIFRKRLQASNSASRRAGGAP